MNSYRFEFRRFGRGQEAGAAIREAVGFAVGEALGPQDSVGGDEDRGLEAAA